MSALDPVRAASAPVATRAPTEAPLGQAAFLRLMTAQLKVQGPFKPMDQTQMLSQLAQFSQVAGAAEMNAKLDGLTRIVDQPSAQTALLERLAARLGPIVPPITTGD